MKTLSLITAVISSTLLASAAPQGTGAPCTTTIHRQPPLETDCTFKSDLTTVTSSIDCNGCIAIRTLDLGLGIPCRTETTIPGTSTLTSQVCAVSGLQARNLSATGASPPPTTTQCTTYVGAFPQLDLDPTVTTYESTVTATSGVECGGCVLATRQLGPGPERKITATLTMPVTTETAYACSASA